jgi:hypothetical protein
LGGHPRWTSIVRTHEDSTNNWGAFAGASRIAASLYLGDSADVARAATVVRGFLGDRTAYASFRGQVDASLYPTEAVWACSAASAEFVPVNGPCTRDGIDLDGAIVSDIWRDEDGLAWPLPRGSAGISYTLESLQGLIVQLELLSRAGYPDAWEWSDGALRRIGDLIDRNAADGGQGWDTSSVSRHVPWLLNARLGTSYPTEPAGFGRLFGYTDWLYGP